MTTSHKNSVTGPGALDLAASPLPAQASIDGNVTAAQLLELLAERDSIEIQLAAGQDEFCEVDLEKEEMLITRQEKLDELIASLPAQDQAGFLGKLQILAYYAHTNYDLYEGSTPPLLKTLADGLVADATCLLRAS